MHNVTLIKGDGIGPSIMEVAVKIIDATGVKINWEEADAGMAAFNKHGTPIPDETLDSIDKSRILVTTVPSANEIGNDGWDW